MPSGNQRRATRSAHHMRVAPTHLRNAPTFAGWTPRQKQRFRRPVHVRHGLAGSPRLQLIYLPDPISPRVDAGSPVQLAGTAAVRRKPRLLKNRYLLAPFEKRLEAIGDTGDLGADRDNFRDNPRGIVVPVN